MAPTRVSQGNIRRPLPERRFAMERHMKTMTLLLPLSAALMLGSAAYAQSDTNNQPNGLNDATMYNSSAQQMDPRQSAMGGMPIDQETSVNGIQAACTGVGDQEENKARWASYPVKLVVAGDHGQYYAGEHVSVTRRGQQVAAMTCNGPWVLMRLQPGAYHATVELPGHAAKNIAFTAPARGQHEVTVHFASTDEDLGGRDKYRATQTSYQRQNNNSGVMMNSGPNENNNTAS
ncbi:MAG TPA: hypothetical protein VG894_04995, partial [Bauldia sp.]|nr:hypothetical protein [Bauldia sp.]